MRVLLDTHALLWWLLKDQRLSEEVRNLLSQPTTEIVVSAVSGWEIATKARLGKLNVPPELAERLADLVEQRGWKALPLSIEHAQLSGRLEGTHKDPFDRMLAAQSLVEGIPLVTNDAAFAGFGVEAIW